MKQNLLSALLMLHLATLPLKTLAESEGVDKESFNTMEMINTAASGLFDCSHYCIVGFQVRWIYVPPAEIEIFYTPVVRHNTADLIGMSAAQTLEQPWLDYRKIFGENAKRIGDQLIQAANTKGGNAEVGGGPTQYEGFGKTQSLNFKDADVVGNPMAFVVEELGANVYGGQYSGSGNALTGGSEMVEGDKDDEDNPEASEESKQAASNYLGNMASNDQDFSMMSDEIYTEFGAEMYKEMVKNHTTVQMYKEIVEQMVDAFADSMDDMVVDFYGCDTFATPFKPFYVSNIDGPLWRAGYPATDAHKSATILNPLSKDVIKPTVGSEADDLSNSAVGQMAGGMVGGWGHLYPRSGFINSSEDYKVGAIAAARGLSIASEAEKRRVRQWAGGSYEDIYFQQVHPTPSTSCYVNIANSITKDDNNLKRNYAWTGWRRYQCPLTHVGGVLATIVWGDTGLCIGNPPQDQ